MIRRRRLIGELALVGVLALLAFPGASSALLPQYVVTLASSGPSPAVMTVPAGYPVVFSNTDTVAHSVAFANGVCSIDVAPGSRTQCSGSFGRYVGHYDYTVDGTSQAQVVVVAIRRSVSLTARRTTIHRGAGLTLHGRLQDAQYPSPLGGGTPQRIIVIARPYAGHPFHRVAAVRATLHRPKKGFPFYRLLWHVRIHPHWDMTYIAIASYQPHGGRVWERARSKPFRVSVGHRWRRPADR
jgi:plastocyanin